MDALAGILIGTQLVFTIVAGLYFYSSLKMQQGGKKAVSLESKTNIAELKELRLIKLSEPLSEKTRPEKFSDIIGQENGIEALRAALCGANPQHILIYGPPGVGKTAAARLVLENAKLSKGSPFCKSAPFIEVDATILQFDERSIADPLIGSVHDPIYQGAGAFGSAGIPQPKPGAVTKAHGGVLFIDEIGEMPPVQMNKLLKVLEDRKVFLSSSYYSAANDNIPKYIHDIFKNGLPADFRLIGATTRSPEEIPAAIRSRCTEIFFRPLNSRELKAIAQNAAEKANFPIAAEAVDLIAKYSSNGRDAVNIVQTALSVATLAGRQSIIREDAENVIEYGRYSPKHEKKVSPGAHIGIVNGLAVSGLMGGSLLEIEVSAEKSMLGGNLKVTGIVEEEEIQNGRGHIKRPSMARASVENVLTALKRRTDINLNNYELHINFPGGLPVDGPSAGAAIFTAVYSAVKDRTIPSTTAITGEISITGRVIPVGGVCEKLTAAIEAGVEKVIIPKENYQRIFDKYPLEIVCVEDTAQLLDSVFGKADELVCLDNFADFRSDESLMA